MSLVCLALSEGDSIQTWWPCEQDECRACVWLKEHFWRHPARLFLFARAYHQGNVRGGSKSSFFFIQPTAPHQQTHFKYTTSQLALMGMNEHWGVKEVYIDMIKHISSWKYTVYWFWKVVPHKSNIRHVKRYMKACSWWGKLSLSTFIHPWISDYSQDYTQSILRKWLQLHKMLNIYRLGKACTGCQGF